MSEVTIYHNGRCSKSRQTLELLRENGVEPEIVEYLTATPTADTLRTVLRKLALKPAGIIRRNEKVLAEENITIDDLDDDALIDLMVKHPILIERPIVVKGAAARIGRPPEQVLEIL
jgi:arsenate reductase